MKIVKIVHDKKNHKFYCTMDEQKCFVKYVIHPGALEFTHTFVPEALRGKGIARMIYDEISQYLKKHKLKAIPTCSYAEKYFREHREDEER
ncbi:MAG: GNAT family N-acetyltransferase [Candidatus Woesearchaeota archaeon]